MARKKAIYERYKAGFQDLPVTMNPYDSNDMEPNFWLSCILIREAAMCKQVRSESKTSYETEPGKTCPDEIFDKLDQYNAQGRPIWKPMHLQPMYQDQPFITVAEGDISKVDVATDVFQRGLCLPSDIKMTEEEQDQIIEIVRSCFA